jgi:hypothetical protein
MVSCRLFCYWSANEFSSYWTFLLTCTNTLHSLVLVFTIFRCVLDFLLTNIIWAIHLKSILSRIQIRYSCQWRLRLSPVIKRTCLVITLDCDLYREISCSLFNIDCLQKIILFYMFLFQVLFRCKNFIGCCCNVWSCLYNVYHLWYRRTDFDRSGATKSRWCPKIGVPSFQDASSHTFR